MIRTSDLCLRRAALYPAELRVQPVARPVGRRGVFDSARPAVSQSGLLTPAPGSGSPGKGENLFEGLEEVKLEPVSARYTPFVTHISDRVSKVTGCPGCRRRTD
jgi:hypothetical protein